MRMELIQPFVGSLDAVLAEMMKSPVQIADLAMQESGYRRMGKAALVTFRGQIEGRVVLDMDPQAAAHLAALLTGAPVDPNDPLADEAVCELANMVIGNAVTLLNDRGFTFKVRPPSVLTETECAREGHDSEATLLRCSTAHGTVQLNIAMRYQTRRAREKALIPVG